MATLGAVGSALADAGLGASPPRVLLTRWSALLASEEPVFLDAVYESGNFVPGTRYTFLAVTRSSVCYLNAEHDDEVWEQTSDHFLIGERREKYLVPRTLVAWRRPLAGITEIGLSGEAWDWIPPTATESEPRPPLYALRFGVESVQIPLQCRRQRNVPDVSPTISWLGTLWRPGSGRCLSEPH